MRINLNNRWSTNSDTDKRLMYSLIVEMLTDWNIKHESTAVSSLIEGVATTEFLSWLLEKKKITAKYYKIETIFVGFDVVEDENLTAYKLSVDLSNPVQFYK